MVFRRARLKDGSTVFIRQHVTIFSAIYFTDEGIHTADMNVGGEPINAFLDQIEKDSVENSNEEEWLTANRLLRTLEV